MGYLNSEFTGNSSHSFKDRKQTVVSFCSTLSKAYERQLETESDGISLTDIAMFLPSWFEINPVLDDPDDDRTQADAEFAITALRMANDMIQRIRTDVKSRLYHMLISITKSDARQLCLQKSIDNKDPAHLLQILSDRYERLDLSEGMHLQRRPLGIRVSSGANLFCVVDDLLNKVS